MKDLLVVIRNVDNRMDTCDTALNLIQTGSLGGSILLKCGTERGRLQGMRTRIGCVRNPARGPGLAPVPATFVKRYDHTR